VNNNHLKIGLIISSIVCIFFAADTSLAIDNFLPKSGNDLKNITIFRKFSTKNGTSTKKISSFTVELASDEKTRNKGLSGRRGLQDGHGMLFILDNSKENYFWMKGMKFSIDIILFDSRKRITEIYENLPLCTDCPFIRPKKPASYALEVNSGEANKCGLKVGDLFEFTEE
jgi:uncharacterized protein